MLLNHSIAPTPLCSPDKFIPAERKSFGDHRNRVSGVHEKNLSIPYIESGNQIIDSVLTFTHK